MSLFNKRFKSNVFFIIIPAFLMISINGCSRGMNIHDVVEKGKGLDKPKETSDLIYKTNQRNKYSKKDIEAAKRLDNEGYKLYKQKKDNKAINYYLQALKIFPMAKTYYNLGNSLMNVYRYKKAEIAYLSALKYHPKNYLYNYNLACAYSIMGKANKSLDYLERALDMGYNAYKYIYRDPDMKNARKISRFDKIMEKYIGNKLTEDLVINAGYCEVDTGYALERFKFNKDNTFSRVTEGQGPYGSAFKTDERKGTWHIEDGQLKIVQNGVKSTIFIKLSTNECTY